MTAPTAPTVSFASLTVCWYCYRPNPDTTGRCEVCAQPVTPPAGTSAADIELWALSHPDPTRRRRAVHQLGSYRDHRALRPLRALLADQATDPDLAVAALRALVAISGLPACTDALIHLPATATAPVRAAAAHLLLG